MKIKKIEELKKEDGISVLVYASPGAGKTYATQYFPGTTLIIDADNGAKCLSTKENKNKENMVTVSVGKDACDIKEILEKLESGELKFDNVVLDTVTSLDLAMLTYFGRNGKLGGAPEQGHYNLVSFKIADICRRLTNLTATGTNVILHTWEQVGEIVYQSGEKVSILKPMVSTQKAPTTLCGFCDIVTRIEVNEKDDTRIYSMTGNSGRFVRDRIFHRKWCPVDELLESKEELKNETKNESI